MQLEFVTVDVFARQRFGGNPLAVVLDGRGLSTGQMQSIAAEFNLSETTFVLPPRDAAHTANVRIFTPRAELPFAGHPNVGTAFVLAMEGACHGRPVAGDTLSFEEIAGLVRIDLLREGVGVVGARLAAPQSPFIGDAIPAAAVAEACSLAASDIDTHTHAPCIVSCGAPFAIACVNSRAALAAARPHAESFARHFPIERANGIHLYAHAVADTVDIHARMFAPLHGIAEDPATGSANVALIGLLAHLRPEADARIERRIAQGVDMGRPSILDTLAVKRSGRVVDTYVGGRCVPVMRGMLTLDA